MLWSCCRRQFCSTTCDCMHHQVSRTYYNPP
jgi:hypothetical protein